MESLLFMFVMQKPANALCIALQKQWSSCIKVKCPTLENDLPERCRTLYTLSSYRKSIHQVSDTLRKLISLRGGGHLHLIFSASQKVIKKSVRHLRMISHLN